MVYNGGSGYGGGTISGGVVNPGPEPFTSGDVSGNIPLHRLAGRPHLHRHLPWAAPKRIAVAVMLDDVAVSYQQHLRRAQQSGSSIPTTAS